MTVPKRTLYFPVALVLGCLWFMSFAHSPVVSDLFLGGGDGDGPTGLGYWVLFVLMNIDAVLFAILLRTVWKRCYSYIAIFALGVAIALCGALVYCLLITVCIFARAAIDGAPFVGTTASQLGDFLTGLLMLPLYGFLLEALPIMARNWVLVVPMAYLTPTAMRWVAVEQQRESELDPANN